MEDIEKALVEARKIAEQLLESYLVEDELQTSVKNMAEAKQYLKNHCYAKYLVEEDTLRRGRIEGLLSYLLNVRYIHEKH